MRFNTNKCVTLRCHRSFNPKSFIYHLGGQPLTCVSEHKYLGIILLTSSMSFSSHINNIISKASCVWNLIRRNLSKRLKEIKNISYLSLVLEYSSAVWDPHTATDVLSLEKIQRRTARWVMSDYGQTSSFTSMLSDLQWPTLSDRWRSARLSKLLTIYQHHHYQPTIHYNKSANMLLSQPPLHYSISENQCLQIQLFSMYNQRMEKLNYKHIP